MTQIRFSHKYCPIFLFQRGTWHGIWNLKSLTSHSHLKSLSLSLTRTQSYSHSHSHLKVQTPNPHTISSRKPVGARRLSSAATSQLSLCLKRLKRHHCDHFHVTMMARGVELWSSSPSPPEGIGEGKVVVVEGAMVMDFLLDDSGAMSFSSSSSSSPFLLPISDQLGFSISFHRVATRTISPSMALCNSLSKKFEFFFS